MSFRPTGCAKAAPGDRLQQVLAAGLKAGLGAQPPSSIRPDRLQEFKDSVQLFNELSERKEKLKELKELPGNEGDTSDWTRFKDGFFKGEWLRGTDGPEPRGPGRFVNGSESYKGAFRHGEYHTQTDFDGKNRFLMRRFPRGRDFPAATLTTATERYTGKFEDGQKQVGDREYGKGLVYHGPFVDGLEEGVGKLKYPDDVTYFGRFKKGTLHGPGSLTWPDGWEYESYFVNGTFDLDNLVFLRMGEVTGTLDANKKRLMQWARKNGLLWTWT